MPKLTPEGLRALWIHFLFGAGFSLALTVAGFVAGASALQVILLGTVLGFVVGFLLGPTLLHWFDVG